MTNEPPAQTWSFSESLLFLRGSRGFGFFHHIEDTESYRELKFQSPELLLHSRFVK